MTFSEDWIYWQVFLCSDHSLLFFLHKFLSVFVLLTCVLVVSSDLLCRHPSLLLPRLWVCVCTRTHAHMSVLLPGVLVVLKC